MSRYIRGNPARWWRSRHVGGLHRAPVAMFISPLRKFSTLLTLTFLLAVIVGGWSITRPERISRLAGLALTNLVGHPVQIKEASLTWSGTLQLRGVEILSELGQEPWNQLLHAQELTLRFDWFSLLTGQLKLTQITAIHPTVRLTEQTEGHRGELVGMMPANSTQTTPSMGAGLTQLPVVLLRDMEVVWGELREDVYRKVSTTNFNGRLVPEPGSASQYTFELIQDVPQGQGLRIDGKLALPSGRVEAWTENLVLNQTLQDAMPRPVRQWWQAHQLHGRLRRLLATYDPINEAVGLRVVLDGVGFGVDIPASLPEPHIATLELAELRGEAELQFEKTLSLRSTGLTARILGIDVKLDADLRDVLNQGPFSLRLQVDDATVGPDYPELLRAFPETSDVLDRLRPQGRFGADFFVTRNEPRAEPKFVGTLDCKDAGLRFAHFPFPVKKGKGTVEFREGVAYFKDVQGSADGYPMQLSGHAGLTPENQTLDLVITAARAGVDESLKLCLPQRYQDAWELFAPSGEAAVTCRIYRTDPSVNNPNIDVQARLLDVSARYERLPYPIQHFYGDLRFTDDKVVVDDLVGQTGPDQTGRIRINGTVVYSGGMQNVKPNLRIRGYDLPVTPDLVIALPASYRTWLQRVQLQGRLGVDAQLTAAPNGDTKVAATMQLAEGRMAPDFLPWAIARVTGRITVADEEIGIQDLVGQPEGQPDARLTYNAKINLGPTGTYIVNQAQAQGLNLDARVPGFLPDQWQAYWRDYQPTAQVDLTAGWNHHIPPAPKPDLTATTLPASAAQTQPAGVGGEISELRVRMTVQDGALTLPMGKTRITDLSGEITWDPKLLEMAKLKFAVDTIKAEGHLRYHPDKKLLEAQLQANAPQMPPALIAAIPGGGGAFIQALKPTGVMQLLVPSFTVQWKDDKATIAMDTNLTMQQMTTTGPLEMTARQFTLQGKIGWVHGGGGVDIIGKIAGEQLTMGKRPIDSLAADIVANSDNQAISLQQITGQIAEGTLQGSLLFKLVKGGSYEASLTLTDANVALIALAPDATEEERKRFGTGRLTASLAVQESWGDQPQRTGRGSMLIHDAALYNVPLTMGLLQIVTLRLPVSEAFSSGEVSYYVQDDKVTFEKVLLASKGMNLAGLGTLDLTKREISMQMVTASPQGFSIPLLSPLLEGLRGQLLQIEVLGPLDQPIIRPLPLGAITGPLARLVDQIRQKSDK
ncbi:MAG: hypothetical protein WCJ97_03085 [Phycisphaerae bacterium]